MFESLQSRIEYISRGGPVMGFIFLASILCVAIVFERWFSLRQRRLFPPSFLNEVRNLAEKGKFQELISLCRSHENPVARVLREGLVAPV